MGIKQPIGNDFYLTRQATFESNVRSYPRKLPLCISSAKTSYITDANHKRYLDCLSGAGTLALGHNHPVVIEAIEQFIQSGLPMHTLDLTTPLKDKFSERVLGLLPGGGQDYCLQFCSPSGSDAVEAALKLARLHTGRETVISFSGGYHGMTLGALSVTANLTLKKKFTSSAQVQFAPFPGSHRQSNTDDYALLLADQLERLVSGEQSGVNLPAAVILEVVQGEGGVNPAPDCWLKRIREITAKHGILLIVDEVQTGFGRTGHMFAFEQAGIEPDLIVLSKAIGGGLPLAVLAIKKQFDSWEAGGHSGTFRGNQLAMATGLATINFIEQHNLIQNARQQGDRLKQALQSLQNQFEFIADVRGRGLMLGVEIADTHAPRDNFGHFKPAQLLAKKLQQLCFNNGLILERGGQMGSVLRLLPALTITAEIVDEIVEKLHKSFQDAMAEGA